MESLERQELPLTYDNVVARARAAYRSQYPDAKQKTLLCSSTRECSKHMWAHKIDNIPSYVCTDCLSVHVCGEMCQVSHETKEGIICALTGTVLDVLVRASINHDHRGGTISASAASGSRKRKRRTRIKKDKNILMNTAKIAAGVIEQLRLNLKDKEKNIIIETIVKYITVQDSPQGDRIPITRFMTENGMVLENVIQIILGHLCNGLWDNKTKTVVFPSLECVITPPSRDVTKIYEDLVAKDCKPIYIKPGSKNTILCRRFSMFLVKNFNQDLDPFRVFPPIDLPYTPNWPKFMPPRFVGSKE